MGTPPNCWKIDHHLCEKMVQTLIPYFWCIIPQWIFFNIIIQFHGLHSTQKSSYIFIQGIIVCHVFNFVEEHHKSFTPSNFYRFSTYQYFTLPFSSSPFELSISFNGPSLTNSKALKQAQLLEMMINNGLQRKFNPIDESFTRPIANGCD